MSEEIAGRQLRRLPTGAHPQRPEPPEFEHPVFATRIDREARLIWVAPNADGFSEDEEGPFDADAFEIVYPANVAGKAA